MIVVTAGGEQMKIEELGEKRSVSELVDAQLERLEDEMERKVEERKGILAVFFTNLSQIQSTPSPKYL